MLYYTHKLLDEAKAKELAIRIMNCNDWIDGKVSAVGSSVKRNLQLNIGGEQYLELSKEIMNLLESNIKIKYYNRSIISKYVFFDNPFYFVIIVDQDSYYIHNFFSYIHNFFGLITNIAVLSIRHYIHSGLNYFVLVICLI